MANEDDARKPLRKRVIDASPDGELDVYIQADRSRMEDFHKIAQVIEEVTPDE